MFDVVAMGECLIDCTPSDKDEMGMDRFSCNPGGAPANVLAMNARLGGHTAFIGMAGEDAFGHFLEQTMRKANICTDGLCLTPEYKTTLAFVQLDEKGDRSFSFYRKPGADIMMDKKHIPQQMLGQCRVFHFGSVSMTDEPCRSATLWAAETAKAAGALISYDPNFRPALWPDEATAAPIMEKGVHLADLVKVSEKEMQILTGETQLHAGAEKLMSMGPAAVLVTMGEDGAYFLTGTGEGRLPSCNVHAVDTTGAGDAFVGAILWKLRGKTRKDLFALSVEEWTDAVHFASVAGGLTTEHRGAIPAMPDRAAMEAFLIH